MQQAQHLPQETAESHHFASKVLVQVMAQRQVLPSQQAEQKLLEPNWLLVEQK